MSELIKLIFECVIKCSPEYADELGRDIAQDILDDWDNGVDYLSWRFVKSEKYE